MTTVHQGATSATVPAGAAHFFFNADAGSDLHIRFTLTPCGSQPSYFENLAGLLADGGGRKGLGLLQAALLFADHGIEPAARPRPLWRVEAALLPPVARALGYASRYPEYASAGGRQG